MLPTGKTVAVKRFCLSDIDLNEFKKGNFLASGLNHCNIVNPLGYCIHKNGDAILLYDYMEYGNLFQHLNDTKNSPLTWKQRLQICIDAAKGLEHLHSGSEHPIIHCDVKSSKILLDEKWTAKLSGSYLSRAGPSAETGTHVSTEVAGTFGYLDPEYFQTCRLTEKCDVYSYGVVLFEVLCGREAVDLSLETELRYLATWATSCFRKGKLVEIVDSSLINDISPECLKIFAETAIACVDLQGVNRPAMRDVVRALESVMHL